MLNHKIARKINQRIYYGWVIVFMAAISLMFSAPGQTYSVSTFINSYISDFQFSRTLISTYYSVATTLSGLLIVLVGKAVDKHGQRKMTVIVAFLFAIVCMINSTISNMWMIFISFFFLRYLGQGSLTLIPSSLIPQWFEKRRALAISLANFGGIAANMLVPVLNVWLIANYSWQFTWRIWSVGLAILMVPLAFFFIVNKPEDIELLPDNAKSNKDIQSELLKMEKASWQLHEAIKTRVLWFVGIISMISPMIGTGMMFHFFSIMAGKGLNDTASSFVIGLIALPGLIMPIIAGLVIDRFRSKYIITITLLIVAIDLLFILLVHNTISAAIFMLVYGLATNVQGVTLSVIWPKYFGRKYLGSIRGAATVFMVIGSALGPIPFGMAYDLTGSYNLAFILMSVLAFTGMILAISIHKPSKQ